MSAILYYFHDPMCSWCYAFYPTLLRLKTNLPDNIELSYVLGGLSPDEDELMPESMQLSIQDHWQRIQQVVPGTKFNFDFWNVCKPRRSTYPACRAVIAATNQEKIFEEPMIEAIQYAYYCEARNPSDYSTHIELARELSMNVEQFEHDLISGETEEELKRQLQFTQSMNVRGFPALVLTMDGQHQGIAIDHTNAENILKSINEVM